MPGIEESAAGQFFRESDHIVLEFGKRCVELLREDFRNFLERPPAVKFFPDRLAGNIESIKLVVGIADPGDQRDDQYIALDLPRDDVL